MIRPFLPLIRPLGRHRLLVVTGVRGLRAAGRHPARRIVLEVIGQWSVSDWAMLFGWYFGIRVMEGYCLVVAGRTLTMAVGGAKDSIVFPPQLASTSPMGTVPSKCRYSLSQTKHETEHVSLLAHTKIKIEITNCNHKLAPSAEGVAHRAEPAAHRGRT